MLQIATDYDQNSMHEKNFLRKPLPAPAKPSQKPERLRIGYFSADFHNHATMYLMAQIFAAHDKSQFEIISVLLWT